MKTLMLAACLSLLSSRAWAQEEGSAGAGIVLGDPTGLTLKYFAHPSLAFDAGIGFSGDAAFYADALWHAWDLFPQPSRGRLGAYVGAGPRVETKHDATFGIRTMAGVAYWLPSRPIELFLEGGPVFRFTPHTGTDFDAGLGIRFYWGPGVGR